MISQTQIDQIEAEQDLKRLMRLMMKALFASKASDQAEDAYLSYVKTNQFDGDHERMLLFLCYEEAKIKAKKLRDQAIKAAHGIKGDA